MLGWDALDHRSPAWGQAPVPPPAKKPRSVPQPGFDDEPAPKKPKPKTTRRRRSLVVDEPEDFRKPVDLPDAGDNERLVEQINATTGEVGLAQIVDEVLADVMAELDRFQPRKVSPMAIRQVTLGANIKPKFSRKLRNKIIAQTHSGTRVRILRCIECEATRTRLIDGQWILTKGLVNTEELRSVGERIGVQTFLDVSFGFDPESGTVEMDFQLIRAEDAQVIWAESFRADESTPMLLRSTEAPMRRKDRLRDLEMLLEGRPYYGSVASAGFMLLPYNDPIDGDITGATAGYRLYERFGEDRQVMFGLDIMGFLNTERLSGAIVSAGSWWVPFRPDLVNPELRLGAKAGAFVAGTEGNAAIFQLGAEVLLRYRFGLYGYVLFMTESAYPGPNRNDQAQLGGLGFSLGLSFNW